MTTDRSENTNSGSVTLTLPPRVKKSPRPLWAVAVVMLVLGFGGWWWLMRDAHTIEAWVEGRAQPVAAGIEGIVSAVLVEEQQRVAAGEAVVQLEDAQLALMLSEERARLEGLRAGSTMPEPSRHDASGRSAEEVIHLRMNKAREQETLARQQLEQQTSLHVKALLEVRRLESLGHTPARSTQLDAARRAEMQAKTAMDAARTYADTMSRSRAATDAELVRHRTAMAQYARLSPELQARQIAVQEAKVREAEQRLSAATVAAPFTGVISELRVGAGSAVGKGQLLATLVPTTAKDLWLVARFPVADKQELTTGRPCSVIFPKEGSLRLQGVVDGLTQPQTLPESLQDAKPEDSVFVRIILQDYDPATMPALAPNMEAKVRLLSKS